MDTNAENNVRWKWMDNTQNYKIYEDGRIYSYIGNQESFISNNNKISLVYNLENGKVCKRVIKLIIYNLFIGNIPKGYKIINIDSNKYNNNIKNLKLIKNNEAHDKNINEYDKNEWKEIIGYSNRYVINKKGDIKSLLTNKILKTDGKLKYNSYKSIGLVDSDNERKFYMVHRLVYCTWNNIDISTINNKPIDHINRDKLDNNLNNLRLVSFSDNSKNRNYEKSTQKYKQTIEQKENYVILSNNFINIGYHNDIDLTNFEINDYGQVKNIKTNNVLIPIVNNGYHYISFWITELKTSIRFSVHQLVATKFLINDNNYLMIHHKNADRQNNHVSNLEWTTNKQNTIYALGKKVNQYSLNGEFIKTFNTIKEAGDSLNSKSYNSISSVCNKKHKKGLGYFWTWAS
jgi:hypothetical protein